MVWHNEGYMLWCRKAHESLQAKPTEMLTHWAVASSDALLQQVALAHLALRHVSARRDERARVNTLELVCRGRDDECEHELRARGSFPYSYQNLLLRELVRASSNWYNCNTVCLLPA